MADDWRIHVELPEEAEGLLARLGLHLGSHARDLARDLEGRRLAVSQDDSHLFVYAGTRREAERAREVIEAELAEEGLQARTSRVQHWLQNEGRWSDELPAPESTESHAPQASGAGAAGRQRAEAAQVLEHV